jgi:hypothetical protein
MGKMDCPYDFKCYKSGFEDLNSSMLPNSGLLVECFETKSFNCKFSYDTDSHFMCTCPLRLYIARKFKK